MGSLVKKQAERFLREKQRQKRWLAIFLCLALVVTSGTFAALRMNGRAMDIEGKVLDCRAQAHEHTEDCYDEQGDLICGQADYLVHTHSAACYDGEGNLVCQIPEREAHVHDDSCYTEEKTLVCGQEEAEGHQHSQECYTQQIGEWICTQEAHEHDPLCYDGEGDLICGLEPHQHGDACYEWNEALTCGQEETPGHTHSEECYETEKTLTCGELELHEHDGPCYENGVLTCTVPELKEHVHNEECFRDADNETDDQLQGDELESEGKDPEQENGGTVSADTADSDSGDTVSADTVSGDSVSADTVSGDSISGNSGEAEETDEPREFSYTDDQVQIDVRAARAGIVPEDAELSVRPIVQQDVEALKADESVSENAVTEAKELNAKYEEVQKELEASVAKDEKKEIAGFLAYDISFLVDRKNEETGEIEKIEIEPDGNVDVSMKFADAYIPEMPDKTISEDAKEKTVSADSADKKEELVVDVVHMKEVKDNKTGETKLEAEVLDAYVDKTEEAKVSEVRFIAESFSTFTIAWGYQSLPGVYQKNLELQIKCCDTNGNELDLQNNLDEIVLSEGTPFLISQISETGTNSGYYAVTTKDGKEYFFKSAVHVQKNQSITNGKEILDSILGYMIFYGGTSWGNYNPQNDEIYFIYATKQETELQTVDTIDSKALGVKMYMLDYPYNYNDIHDVLKAGGWKGGEETSGIVKNELGTDGFPVTSDGRNRSLAEWFANDPTHEVNHLFRQDKYVNGKTFYYNCFENYAYLGNNTDFTVYDALGTPGDVSDAIFLNRGNFFPYNDINKKFYSQCKNLYDENGNKLLDENGQEISKEDAETLYRILPSTGGEKVDLHFSMYLEAEFMQARAGIYNGVPMKYEFTGDDDLWVFIDDKLVLDIGGIHNATSGSIDFSTGEVIVHGEQQPSLKQIFELSGETFDDYSTHTLKMFYMERNGNNAYNEAGGESKALGASNLKISFNLPTMGEDEINVTKQLSNSNQDMYANTEFEFQVYAQKKAVGYTDEKPEFIEDEYEVLKGTDVTNAFKNYDRDTKLTVDEDGIFRLKPGETATFPELKENRKYYVKELGVTQSEYDKVLVNGTVCTEIDDDGQATGSEKNYISPKEEVSKRRGVIFTNNCSVYNSKELQITKEMVGTTAAQGPFDIKVYLENTDGKLVAYEGDYYLTKTETDGTKYYYRYDEQGGLVQLNTIPEKCGVAAGGMVKISPGYTVSITGLIAGTDFKVEELNLNGDQFEEPEINADQTSCDQGNLKDEGAQGSIKLSTDAKVEVVNKPKGAKVSYDWKIYKKGTTAGTDGLSGAEFTLTPNGSDPGRAVYTGKSEGTSGEIVWYVPDEKDLGKENRYTDPIPAGIYTLKEIKAPTNYMLSNLEWKITLSDQDAPTVEAVYSDGTKAETQPNPNIITGKEKTTYEYTFLNTCLYELPSTGGDGIYRYLVSGIFLMMASTLILYKNRRKEVVRK